MKRLVLLIGAAIIVAACGSGGTVPTSDTPGSGPVVGEAGLTALEPLTAEIGSVPRFEWEPVDGAVEYRLAVLGPKGPIWAWEGSETSVNLGGLTGDRPELMPGPVVVLGTSWTVAAFDASGAVIDVVGPISITDEPVTQPDTPATTTTPVDELTAADLPDPCSLIDQDDVDAIFGKPVEPGVTSETAGSGGTASGRSCSWGSLSTLGARIHLTPSYVTPMSVCDYCETIDGYGDEAWGGITDQGSGGGILVVVASGLGIQVEAYGPDVTLEQLGTLADALLVGLP
jgi:hypothetical protein